VRLWLLLLLPVLLLAGCPHSSAPSKDEAAALQASAPLPADSPLLKYEALRLGMSNLDVAQAYNAPEGKGKGFTRGVEEYGDVRNQIITFDEVKGRPDRKLVLRLYQDKLIKLVDRRDGLTAKDGADWLAALTKRYGKPAKQTLPGAQWMWGDRGGLSLTYTQDNQDGGNMSANVVLSHDPSYDASVRYLHWRQEHGEKW
jgi:hypothetical protein